MLVGRDRELKVVDALMAGARLGTSGVLVLTGEAGIGKTALLRHAAQGAGGARVLWCAGTESEQDVAFGGLAQLLRPTLADLDRIPAPQAQALGVALALRDGPSPDRFAIGAATLSLITRLSENQSLVLIVDDAHRLDRSSGEAIAFAARRLLADPVVILVAARSDEPCALTSADLPELNLPGLDLHATGELARASGTTSPDVAARLHQATGGNPLAILELSREPSRLASVPPGSPVPVPAALTAWFAQRVAALDDAARTAVLLAAVAGGELPVIARACQERGIQVQALIAAERAGLVRLGTDRVEFAHPLIRSAVYATAGPAERRALHATVAAALPVTDPDRRAWHRCEAAVGPDDQVAADLGAAGRRATGRGAHAVAATAHERAARLSSQDWDRANRFLSAAESAWRSGDAQRATSDLLQVLSLDRTPALRARALGLQGEIAARRGSLEEAKRVLTSAADEIAAIDPLMAVSLLSAAINACFYLGDARAARTAGRRVEQLLATAAAGPGAGPGSAVGTMAAGMARVLAGESGVDLIRSAVRLLAGRTGDVDDSSSPAAWMLMGPMWLRESGAGRDLVRTVVDERRASSAVGALPDLLFLIARDAATTDDWAGAEADYAEAISLGRELGQATQVAISLAGLAWLEARLGRTGDSATHAAAAQQLCAAQQIHVGRAWVEFSAGELALSRGETQAATETLTALAGWLDEIGVLDPDLSPAPELTEALVRSGHDDRALAVARDHTRRAQAKGQPWALARASRAEGLVCAAADIDRYFGTALEHHALTVDVFEEARTRLVFGARLRRDRRRVDARVQLGSALAMFERLGARLWADEAARELVATGSSVSRGRGDDLGLLTPRELQIALLLARGRTTREAAAALFLSPKTVEYHLRHVYTKLGIASRAELSQRVGAVVAGRGTSS